MTIPTLFFETNRCLPPHQPQAAVARQHGGQREGDADAQKVLGADGLAVFAQDADGCDVGRSADGVRLPPSATKGRCCGKASIRM